MSTLLFKYDPQVDLPKNFCRIYFKVYFILTKYQKQIANCLLTCNFELEFYSHEVEKLLKRDFIDFTTYSICHNEVPKNYSLSPFSIFESFKANNTACGKTNILLIILSLFLDHTA